MVRRTANSHFIPDSEVDGRSPVPLRSWRDHTGAGVPMPGGYQLDTPLNYDLFDVLES